MIQYLTLVRFIFQICLSYIITTNTTNNQYFFLIAVCNTHCYFFKFHFSLLDIDIKPHLFILHMNNQYNLRILHNTCYFICILDSTQGLLFLFCSFSSSIWFSRKEAMNSFFLLSASSSPFRIKTSPKIEAV